MPFMSNAAACAAARPHRRHFRAATAASATPAPIQGPHPLADNLPLRNKRIMLTGRLHRNGSWGRYTQLWAVGGMLAQDAWAPGPKSAGSNMLGWNAADSHAVTRARVNMPSVCEHGLLLWLQ